MSGSSPYLKPRWLRDLLRFLPLKSQFVLSGNVRDLQVSEVGNAFTTQSLVNALHHELRQAGYGHVFGFDLLSGLSVLKGPGSDARASEEVLQQLGFPAASGGNVAIGMDLLGNNLERLVNFQGPPIALIVNFASRLVLRNDALTPQEHLFFSRALILSQRAATRPVGDAGRPYFNSILWIVEKEGDLPDWLLVDNPYVRHIPIAKPDIAARRVLAPSLVRAMPGGKEASESVRESAETAFVEETEGLLLQDMRAIFNLARVEDVSAEKIGEAVRRYKLGVTEDPWLKVDRDKIRNAGDFIRQRVKGQEHAVTHVLDIVKRAITGVGSGRRGNRPRGVAFLAGPTGVGKTELAKTITRLLFGDEQAYIRFDMSEFSAEHADQRLIGAPPGYVGYDVGGELTNAVREKPFSVVLFDEIEKAHPRILDKFLQILDDGVLTSGRGDRVYFSEALLVFTSNLGIYRLNEHGERVANVDPQEPLETIQTKVLGEIERHFKLVLNRPEILNRIGKNVIVFDFIRPEIAEQIFAQMVAQTLQDLKAQEIDVTLGAEAEAALRRLCLADLSNGGRGIRNQVEAHLINPLSRALFDYNAQPKDRFVVTSLEGGAFTTIRLQKLPAHGN